MRLSKALNYHTGPSQSRLDIKNPTHLLMSAQHHSRDKKRKQTLTMPLENPIPTIKRLSKNSSPQ